MREKPEENPRKQTPQIVQMPAILLNDSRLTEKGKQHWNTLPITRCDEIIQQLHDYQASSILELDLDHYITNVIQWLNSEKRDFL